MAVTERGGAAGAVDPLATSWRERRPPTGHPGWPTTASCRGWARSTRGFIVLTVVYLSFVALLPFPTGVLGELGENPTSVVAFALHMGAVSTVEVVLFRHARRRRLFRQAWPEGVYRWALRSSLAPVLTFTLSLPVAFGEARLAILMWFLAIPLGMLLSQRRPADASRYVA